MLIDTKITRESVTPHFLNYSNEAHALNNDISTRAKFLLSAPASIIWSALKIILGLGGVVETIYAAGEQKEVVKNVYSLLSESKLILAQPYVYILKATNPKAKFRNNILRSLVEEDMNKKVKIKRDGDGFISNGVILFFKKVAIRCYNSENLLKRHVASRLTYALLAISCLVTRIFDAIIALVAVPVSLWTNGHYQSLNNMAFRSLQAPGIITDLFFCTVKFINPWALTEERKAQA